MAALIAARRGQQRIPHAVSYRALGGMITTTMIKAPQGISFEVPSNTEIVVKGVDKQQVGQTAAEVRKVRPPEPYKGKGIRYAGEYVRRKVGKRA